MAGLWRKTDEFEVDKVSWLDCLVLCRVMRKEFEPSNEMTIIKGTSWTVILVTMF